eukprot:GDKJ01040210.1.p1 GENE.GDKJ01040210.1~~GDKJ01040210.1.p1  ORF type:complete len:509 (+),score=-14.93 GDKJ01040210.1:55-1527(+)
MRILTTILLLTISVCSHAQWGCTIIPVNTKEIPGVNSLFVFQRQVYFFGTPTDSTSGCMLSVDKDNNIKTQYAIPRWAYGITSTDESASTCVVNDTLYLLASFDSISGQVYKFHPSKGMILLYHDSSHQQDFRNSIIAHRGKVYFSVASDPHQFRCYNPTDGSIKVLGSISDIYTYNNKFSQFYSAGKTLYYNAPSPDGRFSGALWKYDDNTDTHTFIDTLGAYAKTFINGVLYYKNDQKLYKYDGNGKPRMLQKPDGSTDFPIYMDNLRRTEFTVLNGTIYMIERIEGDSNKLYAIFSKYNTVKDKYSIIDTLTSKGWLFNVPSWIVYDDRLYFTARTENWDIALHEYYPGGHAKAIHGFLPKPVSPMQEYGFTKYNNKVYFVGNQMQLYVFDAVKLSIEEVSTFNATVYPNPAKEHTTISFDVESTQQLSIQVTDMQGRVVYHTPAATYAAQKHTVQIPMQSLPSGIYNFAINNGDAVLMASGKIVKE